MRTIILVIIPFLILLLYGGCEGNNLNGDNDSNNDIFCSAEEFIENFANTDCISEELIIGCTNISCAGTATRAGGFRDNCSVLDCETMECERINYDGDQIVTGSMTELQINLMTGFPFGVFDFLNMEESFECSIVLP